MTEAQARWLTHVSPERRRVIVRAVAQRGGWEHISAAEVQALSLGELTGTIRTRGEKPFLVELRRLVNSINRSDRERIVSEIRDAPDLTLTLGRLKELRDFLAQVEAAATAAEGLNDAR